MSESVLVVPNLGEQDFKAQFEKLDLKVIGVEESDIAAVTAAHKSLENLSPAVVGEYANGIAKNTVAYTDELLGMVKNRDLDETGQKLNQVVAVAQQLNGKSILNAAKNRTFFGMIFSKVRGVKNGIDQKFNTTKEQIDALVGEVEASQQGLKDRVQLLERMFIGVEDEYKQLGIYIAAGKIKQEEIQHEIAVLSEGERDQQTTQKIYDLNQLANSLEKRISDLSVLQQSAMQTLPMIRVIQSNSAMLIDKFYAIKNVTIPAWKNQISLSISLSEQRQSVELANTIDNATNELLKRNADLLHQNSVDTARANQRSVIDVDTLEHVQNKLADTVQDVIKIQQEGVKAREEAAIKLRTLQNNLQTIIVNESKAIGQNK